MVSANEVQNLIGLFFMTPADEAQNLIGLFFSSKNLPLNFIQLVLFS